MLIPNVDSLSMSCSVQWSFHAKRLQNRGQIFTFNPQGGVFGLVLPGPS